MCSTWQVTVCIDLSGPTGSIGFELDGDYQGVAFPLPKSRDREGRCLPVMPHLLLRNMTASIDFVGDPLRLPRPGSPLHAFRPWRVRQISLLMTSTSSIEGFNLHS